MKKIDILDTVSAFQRRLLLLTPRNEFQEVNEILGYLEGQRKFYLQQLIGEAMKTPIEGTIEQVEQIKSLYDCLVVSVNKNIPLKSANLIIELSSHFANILISDGRRFSGFKYAIADRPMSDSFEHYLFFKPQGMQPINSVDIATSSPAAC